MGKKLLLLTAAIFITFSLYAKDQGVIECYLDNGQRRSTTSFNLEQTDKKNIYRLTQKGEGDYDNHRNAVWSTESTIELRDKLFYPLESSRIIKNRQGMTIKELKISYDYKAKLIFFTVITPNITIKKKFPLKGITVDGANLLVLVAKLVENKEQSFYLMTDLANMYKINIRKQQKKPLASATSLPP